MSDLPTRYRSWHDATPRRAATRDEATPRAARTNDRHREDSTTHQIDNRLTITLVREVA